MSGAIGNLFGSKGLRAESSTPTGFDSIPEFGRNAFKDAVTRAQTLSQNPDLFAPAGFNADQLASFDLARDGYTNIDADSFGSMLSTFTNPFEEDVISGLTDDIRREGRGVFSDIGAGSTDAGAFGGTRQAVLEGQEAQTILDTIAQTSANERSKNFQSAADRALASIGFNNAAQGQQMTDLLNIGNQQQTQATQVKQSPLQAIQFLLESAGALPTGGGNLNLGAQEDIGFLQRFGNASGGMAAMGAMLSDKRAKENIRYVGQRNGHNIYEFNYIGEPNRWRGVMAQEVLTKNPDAVTFNAGMYHVDYAKLGLRMEAA